MSEVEARTGFRLTCDRIFAKPGAYVPDIGRRLLPEMEAAIARDGDGYSQK